jgi:hypothetical protein
MSSEYDSLKAVMQAAKIPYKEQKRKGNRKLLVLPNKTLVFDADGKKIKEENNAV